MKPVDNIRNGLIDKLLAIQSTDFLLALDKLLASSSSKEGVISLTKEQKLMLQMSEVDIKNGNLLSEEDIDQLDKEWLNGK
jgi:hypothetical protein